MGGREKKECVKKGIPTESRKGRNALYIRGAFFGHFAGNIAGLFGLLFAERAREYNMTVEQDADRYG